MFSNYDETNKKNASVDVSEDKGIQQADELFYLTNHAYGEPDYRYREYRRTHKNVEMNDDILAILCVLTLMASLLLA